MKRLLIMASLLGSIPAFAQNWQVELITGVAGYAGDLTQSSVNVRTLRPAVNLNIKYQLNDYVVLRAGAGLGQVAADDKHNKDSHLKLRNLSFQSTIIEGSLCAEVNLLPPELFDNYPYLFAGIGIFHFEPFAFDQQNNKIALRSLHTEGQGFPEYPDRKPYKLTQFCIPFGGGIKFRLAPNWDIGAELGFRKLFTDYLDDVSATYVDAALLLDHAGPKAVEMAYRGHEVGSNLFDPYPPANTVRGNPDKKDWYYFGGIKLTWYPGLGRDPVNRWY